MVCPICGAPLGRRNKKACSRKCYSALRQHTKDCTVCGTAFPCSPSADTVTCSSDCSRQHRKNMAEEGKFDAALTKVHTTMPDHPLTGKFETHVNAKEWVIQSPIGQVYKCRNLKLWLREHEDLLDGTVKQAWDGITKIKYTMQGKRKNPSKSWKGWTLLEWGD